MTKITHVKITHYMMIRKKMQIKAEMLVAASATFHAILTKYDRRAIYNLRRTGCRQLNVYLNQINRFIKNGSNKFLFKIDKIFSLRFNATFHWIQIDIFIVVNKYLIDSIKKYSMFPFNWITSIFFFGVFEISDSEKSEEKSLGIL